MVSYLIRRYIPAERGAFSTSFAGIAAGFWMPALLSMLNLWPPITVPVWLYALLAVLPIVSGVLVELLSRRIALRLAFKGAIIGILGCTYGVPFWFGLWREVGGRDALLGGVGLVCAQALLAYEQYRKTSKEARELSMPHGLVGSLDETTGWVDPSVSTHRLARRPDGRNTAIHRLLSLSPLLAGLSMVFARASSFATDRLVLIVTTGILACIFAMGAGTCAARFRATQLWERAHGIPVQLKRRRDWQRVL